MLDEGVAPVLLLLLQCALCGAKAVQQQNSASSSPVKSSKRSTKEADKDKEKEGNNSAMQAVIQGTS